MQWNLQNLPWIWPISSLFGAKNDPTNGPREPIYYTHLKVIPVSIKSSCVNPMETFCERDKKMTIDLTLPSQKVPEIWPRVPDCIYTWKYPWHMAKNTNNPNFDLILIMKNKIKLYAQIKMLIPQLVVQ